MLSFVPVRRVRRAAPRGFTLVELLTVVAIIGVLVSILLPALGEARASSRMTVCGANLRQLGIAVHTYAQDQRGFIPRGPEPQHGFDFSGCDIATNQLWTGGAVGPYPPANPERYNGWGELLRTTCRMPEVFFCPADGRFNQTQELPKIRTADAAYGSYIYRQLDHLPPDSAAGRLDCLGANLIDDVPVPVETLALDTNSLGPGSQYHVNHAGRRVNVLYRDGAVRCFGNREGSLALPAQAFAGPVGILAAIDQLFTNADYAYRTGRPAEAPRPPQTP